MLGGRNASLENASATVVKAGGFESDGIVVLAGQGIDIEAIASIGRDATSGGVGLGQESEVFEATHFGANSGRTDIEEAGEGHAADRRSGFGVLFDDGEEDSLLASGDIHDGNYNWLADGCQEC